MISVEHYVACQEALAPLFPKIQLGCNLADFRMEALTLLERAGIQQKDMLSHWENMEPLVDYHAALSAVQRMELGTQEGVIDQWPAWELVRFRTVSRDGRIGMPAGALREKPSIGRERAEKEWSH